MSKKQKLHDAVPGRDFSRLENGTLIVARPCNDLRAPYGEKDRIPDILAQVDHSVALGNKKYKKRMAAAEQEFNRLVREKLVAKKKSVVVVLQGRDGAGKTGARVRIEAATDNDAKIFRAICIGPPSEDEGRHPYLWRFVDQSLPPVGHVRVFDRSWAERLLVEPVMKFATKEEVQASYAEIRTYEWLCEAQGVVLVKLWMDISKDEQKARFEKRAKEKPWKLSDSDAIAREHWDDYTWYANEMFYRTGTDFAPWHIVSSEDKQYSRVAVLEIINETIREACK
jgi:polyphosphate kinase 2 (PPK2 family)